MREGWGCARQHPSPQLLSGNGQQADWGRHRVAALAQRITVKLQERGGQELGWGQGAPAEWVPSLWDAPGCVPPTQDRRKIWGSALSCIYLQENPANLFTNECAAAEVPIIRADRTPMRSTRDRWLSRGRAWPGGRVQVPLCHQESRTLCKNPAQVGAKLDASRWPCLLGAGPVPSLPAGWRGGRGGDRPSPGCWHSREPGSALLPLAEHADLSLSQHFAPDGCSKGLGGAAADGQPDPFLPPHSPPSLLLPSTHPAPMNIYLYLPVCSESLDTIRTLKSARGGCPVRGAPVAPGRQMRVKGRA